MTLTPKDRPLSATVSTLVALTVAWAVFGYTKPTLWSVATSLYVSAALLVLLWAFRYTLPRMPILLAVYAAFAGASLMWAENFGEAFPVVGFLLITTISASLIAQLLPADRLLVLANRSFIAVALACIAAGYLAPSIGIETRESSAGALIGLYVHKNPFGTLMVFGAATALFAPRAKQAGSLKRGAVLAMYGFAIYKAETNTAMVLLLATMAGYLLIRRTRMMAPRDRSTYAAVLVLVPCLGAVLTWLALPRILGLLGRDLTFTGRSQIWAGSFAAWREHRWVGWGWGSAYGEQDTASRIISLYTDGWNVPSSHNGYLSTLVQLGLVGGILLVVLVLQTLVRSFSLAMATPSPANQWLFFCVGLFLLNNIIDTRVDNFTWWIFCVAACHAHLARKAAAGTSERPVRVAVRRP